MSGALFNATLRDIGDINRMLAWQRYNRDLYQSKDNVNAICELLAVNHSNLQLDLFSNSVLDAFIEFLCTTNFLLSLFLCLPLLICVSYVRFSQQNKQQPVVFIT